MHPLRIAIGCSALCVGKGGSERGAVNLAAEMRKRGHDVLLLSTIYPHTPLVPAYPIPEGVRHFSADMSGAQDRIDQLRKFLVADKIDVFLSMQSESMQLFWSMACMGTGIPFIISEQNCPQWTEKYWNKAGINAAHAGADFIQVLLPGYADAIEEKFRHKALFIPFSIQKSINPPQRREKTRKNILYLARFDEAKRPDLLIDAFEILAPEYPEWDLTIWGHGIMAEKLKSRISRMRNGARVHWRGLCENVDAAYADGDIYCLPSRFEGMPNTVLEAMNAGLPIVGVQDCEAMRYLLDNGQNGVLAQEPTPQSLADALGRLMGNEGERKKFAESSLREIENYRPEKVYGQWEEIFYKAASRKGHTVMDAFYDEPFASRARLSSAARREWLFRDFDKLMPYSLAWWMDRSRNFIRNLKNNIVNRIKSALESGKEKVN